MGTCGKPTFVEDICMARKAELGVFDGISVHTITANTGDQDDDQCAGQDCNALNRSFGAWRLGHDGAASLAIREERR